MAVTIDNRTTVFGDRMVVTGSYEAGDNAIDLSGLLASIDFAGVNPSGIIESEPLTDTGAGPPPTQDVVLHPQTRIDGTTIRISSGLADPTIENSVVAQAGTFFAIGRRS